MAHPGDLVHIEGPFWLVVGEGQGRFPRSHSLLVRDKEACALIDTGCGVEVLRALQRQVSIDLVINTHTHPDHAAGNGLFTGRPILVPEPGLETAGDLEALSRRFFPGDRELQALWRAFVREEMGYLAHRPTGCFKTAAGERLEVGSTSLEVIHAPGHCVDHCCFWVEALGLLVGADVDLTRFGPWYGHGESDLPLFRDAIERVRALSPQIVVSSHRPPLRAGIDRAFAAFLKAIEDRSERIVALLQEEKTLDELVSASPIYGGFPYAEALMRSWEGATITHHLTELVSRGAVEATERGWVRR